MDISEDLINIPRIETKRKDELIKITTKSFLKYISLNEN